MTCKLSPTTKLRFSPVFLRSGPCMARKSQENLRIFKKIQRISKEILVLSPKCSFFQHKSARQGFYGRWMSRGTSAQVPEKCHSQAQLGSPRPRNLATDPLRGSHRLMATRGCHNQSSPPVIHCVYCIHSGIRLIRR